MNIKNGINESNVIIERIMLIGIAIGILPEEVSALNKAIIRKEERKEENKE